MYRFFEAVDQPASFLTLTLLLLLLVLRGSEGVAPYSPGTANSLRIRILRLAGAFFLPSDLRSTPTFSQSSVNSNSNCDCSHDQPLTNSSSERHFEGGGGEYYADSDARNVPSSPSVPPRNVVRLTSSS